jgi:mgtE-like transporter
VALGNLSPDLLAELGLDAGRMSPGFLTMLGVSALAGLIATTAAALAAYYGSILSYRAGLDPDTYGIPIITSAVDLLGFMSLIIALVIFQLA